MKPINFDWLGEFLRGLISGEIKLVVATSEAKKPGRRGRPKTVAKAAELPLKKARRGRPPKSPKKAKTVKPGKRGRKAFSPAVKEKKAEKVKAVKARQAKRALPLPQDLFQFMVGKIEGLKLSDITKQFGVKQGPMKGMLKKLVKKGDLDTMKGRYFLHRRLRPRGKQKQPQAKPQPIAPAVVLEYLAAKGPSTLPQMAKDMGEPSFHRLIRVANGLKKAGKVTVDGKNYRLVGDDPLFLTGSQPAPEPTA